MAAKNSNRKVDHIWEVFWFSFDNLIIEGYGSGCQYGQAAAIAYMKYLKQWQPGKGRLLRSELQHVGATLAWRCNGIDPHSELHSGLRGVIVGFYSTLTPAVAIGLRHANTAELDHTSDSDIEKLRQDALEGGPDNRWHESMVKARSDQARAAARVRWNNAMRADQAQQAD